MASLTICEAGRSSSFASSANAAFSSSEILICNLFVFIVCTSYVRCTYIIYECTYNVNTFFEIIFVT